MKQRTSHGTDYWYIVKSKKNNNKKEVHEEPLILKSLTIIDPATGWFYKILYTDKQAATIANMVYQT